MPGQFTLTIIKPDAVAAGHAGAILNHIIKAGFRLVALKMVWLTIDQARLFYAVHRDKPFFESLTAFMSSGPIIAAVLQRENAVESFRRLIGATNPAQAADGTLRRLFATSVERNAVHGSDSDENADRECAFFFSQTERFAHQS